MFPRCLLSTISSPFAFVPNVNMNVTFVRVGYFIGHNTLQKAKKQFGVNVATVTGQGLGAIIAGYVANNKTRSSHWTKGPPVRSNEKAYRTLGDAVSLLNAKAKRMTTLANPNKSIHTGNPLLDMVGNIPTAHNVSNIKNSSIFV